MLPKMGTPSSLSASSRARTGDTSINASERFVFGRPARGGSDACGGTCAVLVLGAVMLGILVSAKLKKRR